MVVDTQLVTIGIPMFNAETTIDVAIRSVLAQTYSNWQLLLVDDGSSDRTEEIARSFSDPRIFVSVDGQHKGLAARLNQITDWSDGPFVARMDSDDIMAPNRIMVQASTLGNDPSLDLVSSSAAVFTSDYSAIGLRTPHASFNSPTRLLKHSPIIHPTVMGTRRWFVSNRYNESLARNEDKELWFRTRHLIQHRHIPQVLYYYREEPELDVEKYLFSVREEHMIARCLARAELSKMDQAKIEAWFLVKHMVTRSAVTLGRTTWIVTRRNEFIANDLITQFNADLRTILAPLEALQ